MQGITIHTGLPAAIEDSLSSVIEGTRRLVRDGVDAHALVDSLLREVDDKVWDAIHDREGLKPGEFPRKTTLHVHTDAARFPHSYESGPAQPNSREEMHSRGWHYKCGPECPSTVAGSR